MLTRFLPMKKCLKPDYKNIILINLKKIKTKKCLYDIMRISIYGIKEDLKMNLYEKITKK